MRLTLLLVLLSGLVACDGTKPGSSAPSDAGVGADADVGTDAAGSSIERMSLEQLQDPETCKSCHPKQYAEWSRSMHAYASLDPVFIAMNQRGQRETNGTLGKFCVQCHAPMAVNKKLTTDGLNLASLPKSVQGVTCYFCHNTSGVGTDHFNANLTLANDTTMRGSIKDAHDPGVHAVAYSAAHDSFKMDSSYLCGTCHDVVNQRGTHIERTLEEYKGSFASLERNSLAKGGDSCQGCHMRAKDTDYIADVPSTFGLKKRPLHDHSAAAVDVALSDDFGDAGTRALQRQATEYALTLGGFVFEVVNDGLGDFRITIETNAGHKQPSGTAQDRRMWLEVIAYDAQNNVLFQSGVIGDQEVEEYDPTDARYDPQLCNFRERFFDDAGIETHDFWEAATVVPNKVLPTAVDLQIPHTVLCEYRTPGHQQPARLTMRMLVRPVGMDVLQDLIDSGDLDAAVKAKMPTFQVQNTVIEWTADQGPAQPTMPQSKLPPLYPPP